MSEDVDFILSDIKSIKRPSKAPKTAGEGAKPAQQKSRSFQIQKSFIPKPASQVHEQLRPEVEKLKVFLKAKKEKERKLKQMLADGAITKQEFQGRDKLKSPKQKEQQEKEKYTIDESGQLRDQKGNLVFLKPQTSELKINQKKENQLTAKELSKKQKIKFHEKLSRNLLDRNLVVSGMKKKVRRSMLGLHFLEKGSYQSYTAKKKDEVVDLDQALKGQQEEHRVIKKRQKTKLEFTRQTPICEWWDQAILQQQYLNKFKTENYEVKVEQGVQELDYSDYLNIESLCNQVTFQKVGDQKREPKVNIPVYLTQDQRKKLKRKRKREKLIEKNDMIKLGLIEPEKPKLKISNMAIVMRDQFIVDPSKVEAEAKKQQQERLNNHLEANQSRKLTKNQKKEKAIRKLKKDSAKECKRIVFRLEKLEDPSQVFKVNMNAKQLSLNGFVLKPSEFHRQPVMIMAEGGQKAIRFFKNLMLNRIRWNEDPENGCKLLWEGQIDNSRLGKWRTCEVGDQSETIRILTEKGVQNFCQYLT